MDTYLNSIIQRLKSDKPITITSALNDIEEMIKANLITPEIVDFLFLRLVPFLVHNNYNIRLTAFDLETYFLKEFCDYVYDSNIAFPNVISSLSSVNKKIVKNARDCASIIMNIEYPSKWWPEIDTKLTNSRSLNQRLIILDLLLEHTDEIHHNNGNNPNIIPVQSICKLLTDPKLQIQRKAMSLLENVQQEDLNSSLQAAEDLLRLTNPSDREIMLSPKIKVEQRRLRNRQVGQFNSALQNQEDILSQNSAQSFSSKKSQLSVNSKSQQSITNLNNENVSMNSVNSRASSHASSRASRSSRMSKSSRNSKTSQNLNNTEKNLSSIEKESTKIVIKEEKPLEENVGFLPVKQKAPKTLELKDLSALPCPNKYEFLFKLDKLLQQDGKMQIPNDQIVDCVLTASFPINRQICPLLSKILSDVLPHNPELISLFKNELLKYILFGIRLLNDQKPFKPLTDTIFLEGDPNEIVDAAVQIANSEKRSLHLESYFLPLFESENRVTLNRQTLFNFLCYLIYRAYPDDLAVADKQPEYLDDVIKLLCIGSSRQNNLYVEFKNLQPQKAKSLLERYIVNDAVSATKPYEKSAGLINYENPLETVNKEFKKGEKSNLLLIADALVQVDFCSLRRTEIVFADLIKFFSVLSSQKVQRHITEIRRICGHFTSPQLLNIIDNDNVVPDLIFGVAIFVWNCAKNVIKDGDTFYPKLYSIFKRADGEIREQIVLIEMAISKASEKSFIDLDQIPNAHKILIQKMERQFVNSEK